MQEGTAVIMRLLQLFRNRVSCRAFCFKDLSFFLFLSVDPLEILRLSRIYCDVKEPEQSSCKAGAAVFGQACEFREPAVTRGHTVTRTRETERPYSSSGTVPEQCLGHAA